MPLTPDDKQWVQDFIAEKLDLVSAFRGLDVADREKIAADLEKYLYSRQEALRKPVNTYTPRITVSGADLNLDDLGVSKGHLGPTLPQTIDFIGSGGYLDRTDPSIAHIRVTGGSGSDCMFNFLVSSCFATLTGFTEGMVFTTLSGCTFKGYSTPALAVAQAAIDFASTTPAIVYICPATYTGTITLATSQYVELIGAGQDATILTAAAGSYVIDGNTNASPALWLRNLTVKVTGTGKYGIQIKNGIALDIDDCHIIGGPAITDFGLYVGTTANNYTFGLRNSVISGGYGVFLAALRSHATVTGNLFLSNTLSISCLQNVIITGNTFNNNSGASTSINLESGASNIAIVGNQFIISITKVVVLNDIIGTAYANDILIEDNVVDSCTTFIDVTLARTAITSTSIQLSPGWIVRNNSVVCTTFIAFPVSGVGIKGVWNVKGNSIVASSSTAALYTGTTTFYPEMRMSDNFVETSTGSAGVRVAEPVDGGLTRLFTAGIWYIYLTSPLTIGVTAFTIRFGDTDVAYAGGNVALTGSSATNYVEINSAGTLSSNTTAFTTGTYHIAKIVTTASATATYSSHTDVAGVAYVAAGASGGVAASTEAFVTIGNTAGLSAERALALTPADGEHTFTDGGANASVTLVGVDTASGQKGHVAFDATVPAAIGTAAAGAATTAGRRDHVHPTGAGTPSTQAFGDAASTGTGPAAAMTDHKHAMPANPVSANGAIRTISFIVDGGGSTITTGIKGDLEVPFACTINRVTMLADQSGSIVVDIWKDTYANYPPTVADTITAAAKPTITTATKSQDATLTGWTTSIAAGDTLRYNVDSITTCTRVLVSLKVTES